MALPLSGSKGSVDFAQDDLPVSSMATLIAAIMLSGRAMPLPAISNAVPWSGLVRGKGRPSVTFTPSSKGVQFQRDQSLVVIHAEHAVEFASNAR